MLNDSGVRIVKRFTLSRNSYDIGVQYIINNGSASDWNGTFYGQIKRDSKPPVTDVSGFSMQPFIGAALRQPEKNYAKFDFSDIEEDRGEAFKISSLSESALSRFVIQYIEPEHNNKQAIGLDIGSEMHRRNAALSAARDNSSTLTSPITLVQADAKVKHGFLLLLPLSFTMYCLPMPFFISKRSIALIKSLSLAYP